ncbi:hypothetical protein KKE06_05410 [Candidatus Micrarchaeota archaeon]|nr:hypothetical protein [Candidatus Micrarchaeota archaeon]
MSAVTAIKWSSVIILAFLLLTNILLISILFPVKETVLTPNTWTELVERVDIYEQFSSSFEKTIQEGVFSATGFSLRSQNAKDIMEETFSKEWFDNQLSEAITRYFGFLNGNTTELNLSLSLAEPKQKLPASIQQRLPLAFQNPVAINALVKELPNEISLIGGVKAQESFEQQLAAASLINDLLWVLIFLAIVWVVGIIFLVRSASAFLVLALIFLVTGALMWWLGSMIPVLESNLIFQSIGGETATENILKAFNFQELVAPVFLMLGEKISIIGFYWVGAAIIAALFFVVFRVLCRFRRRKPVSKNKKAES